MTQTDLRQMIEIASSYAENAFARVGIVAPIWHLVTADGEHVVMPAPDVDDKDIAAMLMRAAFELHDVVRYVCIHEAWTVEGRTPDEIAKIGAWIAEHGSVGEYPDRIECVMMCGDDVDAGQMTGRRRIIRERGRKPRLGPLIIDDLIGVQSEGRLVGMLTRRSGRMH